MTTNYTHNPLDFAGLNARRIWPFERVGHEAITKALHDKRVARRGRPLTDGPMMARHAFADSITSALFDSTLDLSDRCALAEANRTPPRVEPYQPRRSIDAFVAAINRKSRANPNPQPKVHRPPTYRLLDGTEPEHGTIKGYRRHLKVGEPACDLCRATGNAHDRARRAAKGAAA